MSGNGLTPAIADQTRPVSGLIVAPGGHADIVLDLERHDRRLVTDGTRLRLADFRPVAPDETRPSPDSSNTRNRRPATPIRTSIAISFRPGTT
jgi:hypothetical protein